MHSWPHQTLFRKAEMFALALLHPLPNLFGMWEWALQGGLPVRLSSTGQTQPLFRALFVTAWL